MQNSILLELPNKFTARENLLAELCELNPGLSLEIEKNILRIEEKDLPISEMDFFELHLPFKMEEEEMVEISGLNNELRMEMDAEAIIINMGTAEFISIFAVAITIALGIWNKKKKLGRILESQGGHDLIVDGKKLHRMPDVAFHLNDKFNKKILDKTSRAGAPFLCIEVVSNKNSLNQDLRKMQNDWMRGGTEIGLVVCPHRQEYYQFEQGISGYQSYPFSHPFTHTSLPDLILNFEEILQESLGEVS